MSRDVPFYEDQECDLCGCKGAYDFTGDCICPDCLEKQEKNTGREAYPSCPKCKNALPWVVGRRKLVTNNYVRY